mgnify:CR=1 FL=1
MRRPSPLLRGSLAGAATIAVALLAAASRGEGSPVLARVGPATISVATFEERLAALPPLQLALYGSTVAEARRAYLESEVVREELLVQGALRRGVDRSPEVRRARARVLADAAVRAAEAAVGAPGAIPDERVAAYYNEHRERYEQPERILVHRILLATREEAEAVLKALQADPTPAQLQSLAREKSLDKATYLRGGALGFLAPDGTSSEVGLRVDPALYKAAATVKDGGIVASPVAEGNNFAVVARRGTLAARRVPLASAAPQIRETLHREARERAGRELVERLRREHLRDLDVTPLLTLVVSGPDDEVRPTPPPSR